jgi:glycosyltransferase involved in cell wall biosynthesis
MNVCHTVFAEMPAIQTWDEFAVQFPWIAHLLLAQQELGLQLVWIAPSTANHTIVKEKIKLRFFQARRFPNQSKLYRHWTRARRLTRAILEERPEVIHHHGLNSWMALRALQQLTQGRSVRRLVQDHGGGMPASGVKHRLYRKALASIHQAIFGDSRARDRWIQRGLLAPEKCQIIFAASSVFKPAPENERLQRRRQLQMTGAPILGWVAHLDHNKDPLTILRAGAFYFAKNSAARLYMHFINDGLRAECEQMIAAHPALQQRVFLRGRLPHAQLESFYQALDYFIQGSHHEAYGYTAVEAMSTGALPILTDIPSFRLLCDQGRCGYLFPPGDAAALQNMLCRLPPTIESAERARVIQHFEKKFSYPVLAQKFLALYHG